MMDVLVQTVQRAIMNTALVIEITVLRVIRALLISPIIQAICMMTDHNNIKNARPFLVEHFFIRHSSRGYSPLDPRHLLKKVDENFPTWKVLWIYILRSMIDSAMFTLSCRGDSRIARCNNYREIIF